MANLLPSSRRTRISASAALAAATLLWQAAPVYAQIDPTLFLKRTTPNVVIAIDVANRMQRDAPTDQANWQATSNYYDTFPYPYTVAGALWEPFIGQAGVSANYRRRYGFRADGSCGDGTMTCGFTYANGGGDKFAAGSIVTVGSADAAYSTFYAPTRLAIARAALYQAVKQNQNVARFGLVKMRQNGVTKAVQCLDNGTCQVNLTDALQQATTETGANSKWWVARPTVAGNNSTGGAYAGNGSTSNGVGPLLAAAESASAAANILTILSKKPDDDPTGAGANTLKALIPAGNDASAVSDAPLKRLLDDAATEVGRLIDIDNGNANSGGQQCRNTVVILVTGGGEGSITGEDPAAKAATYLNTWAGRNVPIYVVALAPPTADRATLQDIASKSGGRYFEVTKTQIDAALSSTMWSALVTGAPAGTVVVPEVVRAINIAIQAAFENYADFNNNAADAAAWVNTNGVPAVAGEFNPQTATAIPSSEFQVTTPIIGTVNMIGAHDASGALLLPDPLTVKDRQNNVIPQRSNMMLTAAFGLPSFDGKIRAYRVYKPEVDATQPSGWKFKSDGTNLWTACAPGTTTSGPCAAVGMSTDLRNLYTTLADGTMVAFTAANAAALMPLMNLTSLTDAQNVINKVRSYPIGTILDSTPAIMNPPSLDPPPDNTYPAFAVAQKDRRAIIWVGTNRGIFEGIDARLGVEVWGYIPMNLLPKLRTLWDGQAVGSTDFMMDGSPKISDIRQADGTWKTYMFLTQGAGGTFYQTLDVTLDNMVADVDPTDDVVTNVLNYFTDPNRIAVKWSFPSLANWEPNCANLGGTSCTTSPYGDLKLVASATEKSVGQTWSDPAIGQVQSQASPYVMLVGSGFLPYSVQQQPNRAGAIAGTTFYMFNAETGALLASKSVGSDGSYEQQDNCSGTNTAPTPSADCTRFKNALHSDPVATGPADSRFITKSYIGDLDGRLWRFDISLDGANVPQFNAGANPTKLYDDPLKQPIFASMATVNVGGSQQYIFTGTGSDLLPSNNVSQQYRLLGILDNGATGTKTFEYDLVRVDNTAGDEKVTTFPAVAGDIVFFTTTTFNPATPCTLPTASLYALTFIGGAAYDTNGDNKFTNQDSVLVKSVAGERGTAPFIVDQHLVFGTGGKVQMFGDSADYNNGIGQAGVRILSWREVR